VLQTLDVLLEFVDFVPEAPDVLPVFRPGAPLVVQVFVLALKRRSLAFQRAMFVRQCAGVRQFIGLLLRGHVEL
jgi:hypothetical protein